MLTMMNLNNPPPITMFNILGESLPHGEYIFTIEAGFPPGEICIDNALFSHVNGEQIDPEQVYIGPCVSTLDCPEDGEGAGDVTGDGEVNILDIVWAVNLIL